MVGEDSVKEYRERLLSRSAQEDPFQGIKHVSERAEGIAEHSRPFKIWVPESGYAGDVYLPSVVIFGDIHNQPQDRDFLKYHRTISNVILRMAKAGIAKLERDRFLFESVGVYAAAADHQCGRVGPKTYEKSKKLHNGNLNLYGFGTNNTEHHPILDKRHAFSRLFSAFRGPKPYTEFLGNPELMEKSNAQYAILMEIQAMKEKDPSKSEGLLEIWKAYKPSFDETLDSIALDAKAQIGRLAGRDMTFVVLGLSDVIKIHLTGGLESDGQKLEYMCLVPWKSS